MTGNEFSTQFDLLYNNVTSNQAPGLNEWEKSSFLTKAQDELIKNYFLPQSNPKQTGFDGSKKRQMDFSLLMCTHGAKYVGGPYNNEYTAPTDADPYNPLENYGTYDPRGTLYTFPDDLFIPINETLRFVIKKQSSTLYKYTTKFQRQVIPLSMEEYTRLMSKPYKEPLKEQAWRLLVNNEIYSGGPVEHRVAEIIIGHNDVKWLQVTAEGELERLMQYFIRYIRKPKPIIIAPLDSYGITIDGHNGGIKDYDEDNNNEPIYDDAYKYNDDHTEILNPCELDDSIQQEILQRAVELAKVAWVNTGNENTNVMLQVGQRSE